MSRKDDTMDMRTKPIKQKPWPDDWVGCYISENLRFKPEPIYLASLVRAY